MSAPRIIAHRGASDSHPDNSWAAFEAAVAEGADAIECDVQGCRTGEIVTRHDLELGGPAVADLSFAELGEAEPDIVRLADLLRVGRASAHRLARGAEGPRHCRSRRRHGRQVGLARAGRRRRVPRPGAGPREGAGAAARDVADDRQRVRCRRSPARWPAPTASTASIFAGRAARRGRTGSSIGS